MLRNIQQIIESLPSPKIGRIPTPEYVYGSVGPRIALVVECMKRHMSDEGWQLMLGLESTGYSLFGYGVGSNVTEVRTIVRGNNPSVVLVQDKKEWDVLSKGKRDFREPKARFHHINFLKKKEVFGLTVLRDAHQRPEYHREAADEMGANAWVVFYHPRIVHHLAPYTRPKHIIRTYNSIDPSLVPCYTSDRSNTCLLSGALSRVYPLRRMLRAHSNRIPGALVLGHPGYHASGSCTPEFLRILSRHKVAICTSSIYGYALRKIIEATACGCVVLTDLPTDDILPEIDGNLVRISPKISPREVSSLVQKLYTDYDSDKQEAFAEKAKDFYSYFSLGAKLSQDIERLRCEY